MATKLPPNPIGVPPGSSYWNDWYEKLRYFVETVSASIGTGLLVRADGATLTNTSLTDATLTNVTLSSGITTDGGAGLTTTAVLAKITGGGVDGLLTFTDGILTAKTDPT